METRANNEGPLAGLRVVELGGIGPAPFAGMTLADFGADVIRVDRPGDVPSPLHRGKRVVGLNLKSADDATRARRLLERADILIEGFRPGATERLGFGPEDVWGFNSRLVYARMTGWGQGGPLSASAGHDVNYIALTGVLHAIGTQESGPVIPLNVVGDFGGGGVYLVMGILAAVYEARATGRGQIVEAAIVDGVAHLMSSLWGRRSRGSWVDEREQNQLDGGAPYYAVYETADGRHMAVGAIEANFYRLMLDHLGLADEPTERQNDRSAWPRTRQRIAERFLSATQDQWIDVFWGTDACVTPVRTLEEAAHDPHLLARGTLIGDATNVQSAVAPRFSGHTGLLPGPAPAGLSEVDDVVTGWDRHECDGGVQRSSIS